MPLRKISEELISEILCGYGSLKSLNLANNQIEIVENLERLPNLTKLNLSKNCLYDINNLANLPLLVELNLENNRLSSVNSLGNLRQLKWLNISWNKIIDFRELDCLGFLPELIHLLLTGNPICECPDYRCEVLSRIPKLISLDELEITPAERIYLSCYFPDLKKQAQKAIHLEEQRFQIKKIDKPSQHDNNLLLKRVEALEEMIKLQEEQISSATALEVSRLQRCFPSKENNYINDFCNEDQAICFVRLVKNWRKKVFSLLVQLKMEELKVDQVEASKKLREKELQEIILTKTLEMKYQEQKYLDMTTQAKLKDAAIQQAIGWKTKQNQMQQMFKKIHFIVQQQFQKLREDTKIEQLLDAIQLLGSYDQRLAFANARIKVVGCLMNRKNVELRNSQAALEAEKIIWVRKLQREEINSTVKQGKRKKTWKGLTSECEEAMRKVFNRLDYKKTGLVNRKLLIEALKKDVHVIVALSHRSNGVKKNIDALGQKNAPSKDPNTTWGEFLLFCIPDELVQDHSQQIIDEEQATKDFSVYLSNLTPYNKNNKSQLVFVPDLSPLQMQQEIIKLTQERAHLLDLVKKDFGDLQRASLQIQSQWESKVNDYIDQIEQLRGNAREQENKWNISQSKVEELEQKLAQVTFSNSSLQEKLVEMEEERRKLEEEKINSEKKLKEENNKTERKLELEIKFREELLLEKKLAEERKGLSLEKEEEEKIKEFNKAIEQAKKLAREESSIELNEANMEIQQLQRDHAKSLLQLRRFERELCRLKDQQKSNESSMINQLKDQLAAKDEELKKLRKEKSTLLKNLKEKETNKKQISSSNTEPKSIDWTTKLESLEKLSFSLLKE